MLLQCMQCRVCVWVSLHSTATSGGGREAQAFLPLFRLEAGTRKANAQAAWVTGCSQSRPCGIRSHTAHS
jgi:hypothetical protein